MPKKRPTNEPPTADPDHTASRERTRSAPDSGGPVGSDSSFSGGTQGRPLAKSRGQRRFSAPRRTFRSKGLNVKNVVDRAVGSAALAHRPRRGPPPCDRSETIRLSVGQAPPCRPGPVGRKRERFEWTRGVGALARRNEGALSSGCESGGDFHSNHAAAAAACSSSAFCSSTTAASSSEENLTPIASSPIDATTKPK